MKPRRLKHLFLLMVIGLLLFGTPSKALGRDALTSQINAGDNAQSQLEVQALQSKVQEDGKVRVIVTLDLDFKPEGELASMSAVQSQRSGIQQAQQGLVTRLQLGQEILTTRFRYVPQIALEVDAVQLQMLLQDPAVLSVQEDILSRISLDGSIPLIGADDAWAAGYSGAGQVVAVLDTGVDSDHVFLNGKVVSEACFSNYWGNRTTLCPNNQQTQVGSGAAEPCTIPNVSCDHGTHVAGIVAGSNASFSGVAPDAGIIAVQVFTRFDDPLPDPPGGTDTYIVAWASDIILGLEHVYSLKDAYNIAAVNMSLGGSKHEVPCDTDPRRTAIQNLRSAGIATVVASGNDDYRDGIDAPACISEAISVGSTELDDDVSTFSNVAYFLDFFAPGTSIYSSITYDAMYGWYWWKSGTSMAAPHVAGAWAVIRSKAPSATVDFVYNALSSTGVLVDDDRSGGIVDDIPRIQLDAAIDSILDMFLPIINDSAGP